MTKLKIIFNVVIRFRAKARENQAGYYFRLNGIG